MGWLKVDDKMPRNPKILAGDVETAWYYACALTHAAEQLTDGFIARSAVPLVAPHITDPCSVAERCADLELFRRLDDGYLIPDYLEFNPSRESVMTKRAEDAERQRKKRERDASREESQRDTAETSGVSPDVPSRPVPSVELSPHPPTGSTERPVDNPKIDEIIAATVTARLGKQQSVRSPDAWKRTAEKNLRADREWLERVERLVADYDAPLDLLVLAAEGETSPNLRHYRTNQETA